MESIIDNEFASLVYYPDKKIVHHTFKKFIFGDAFKEVLTKGADLFCEHGCRKWLSDDRSNSALREEDIEWGQENWEGRIIDDWDYWALVMPEKVLGQMNMNKLIERYASMGVTVKTFSDPTLAMAWLESQ